MFDMRIKDMFFDRPAVMNALSKAERHVFSKFGAFVYTTARNSVSPGRRSKFKPNGEMTDRERRGYKIRLQIWKRKGLAGKPRRPLRASRPGQPPISHTRTLKKTIFFGLDPSRHTVVIGPVSGATGGGATEALEYGGIAPHTRGTIARGTASIAARPFMRPAFSENIHHVPQLWKDAMRK